MKNVIFIIGLPASGKTEFAKEINKDLNFVIIDDPKNINEIIDAQNLNKDLIIVDPYLIYDVQRSFAEEIFKDWDKEYVYFENNPEQCLINAKKRNDLGANKIVDNFIINGAKEYKIPQKDVFILPVYSGEKN